MGDVIDRIAMALDHVWADGRKPSRLLLGHRDAAEADAAIRPSLYPPPPKDKPLLPYPLTGIVTIFGVRVERVDQPSLVGVIAEGDA